MVKTFPDLVFLLGEGGVAQYSSHTHKEPTLAFHLIPRSNFYRHSDCFFSVFYNLVNVELTLIVFLLAIL